jgi:pyruvate, water dikinase
MSQFVKWFEDLSLADLPLVGGKNASLGEMTSRLKASGVRVPEGFAVTADGFRDFLDVNRLRPEMERLLAGWEEGGRSLPETGKRLRALFLRARIPGNLAEAISAAYGELRGRSGGGADVAVRSSATAEDLPDASFAGQHETFLNVRGEKALLDAVRRCFASLFTDRALSYRKTKGFDHMKVFLSVGVQRMVRSDRGGSGVLFTLDTDTGFPRVAVVNAVWGLGETIVQGISTPDEHVVFKPLLEKAGAAPIVSRRTGAKEKKMVYGKGGTTRLLPCSRRERTARVLTDDEVLVLARWGAAVERHYGKPMDVEWAKDGETGELFIVQARPETVQARRSGAVRSYRLTGKGERVLEGGAVGDAVAQGPVQVIRSPREMARFKAGSILVTTSTDPDWVPLMKKAAGIVTDHGGRTSHAAIVSRELGLPAVVGTGRGTQVLKEGRKVTISCAEGPRGYVYPGQVSFEVEETDPASLPAPATRILLNIASPEAAFRWWRLPVQGVGLARMEFIISDAIKVHPMALAAFDRVKDARARRAIKDLTKGYKDRGEYFVERLSEGIAPIAAAHHPNPVIVRLSDFKTNEYAGLIGGREFEPVEENPMLGFRGASRYYDDRYKPGFALECRALKRVREDMGLDNVVVMVPFCRTPAEADKVLAVMAENGLRRGEKGLQVYVMCEIPSNVILAEQFAERFDGFSIGSNDLTQLTLGVDRDSGILAKAFDERDEAVKRLIQQVIEAAHRKGRPVGICGQAPSDHPDFARFLVEAGIDSISLNPDSVIPVIKKLEEKP